MLARPVPRNNARPGSLVTLRSREMQMGRGPTILAIFTVCAAFQSQAPQGANEFAADNAVAPSNDALTSPDAIAPGEPGGLPGDRNLLQEGPIDPKSAEGAGQVLQRYAALL